MPTFLSGREFLMGGAPAAWFRGITGRWAGVSALLFGLVLLLPWPAAAPRLPGLGGSLGGGGAIGGSGGIGGGAGALSSSAVGTIGSVSGNSGGAGTTAPS